MGKIPYKWINGFKCNPSIQGPNLPFQAEAENITVACIGRCHQMQ